MPNSRLSDGDTSWFVRDRFGLFIHWGLYALLARHEWVKQREAMSDEVYDRYFRHFDPDLYNPALWAKAASDAGMKYVVATSKHHDGFCLWDSAFTDYKATAKAHVDSVTCFARCHHGHIYYDSKRNPERVHPHLVNRDLLRAQIEACHKRGIRVPIYTTVQWDDYTADAHRDWLLLDEHGTEFSTPPLKAGFYRFLDLFHPGYRAFMQDHVQEILETLPVDGLFFDIVQPKPSLAKHWLEAMDAAGYDPEDEEDRRRFAGTVVDAWKLDMTAFVRRLNGDCTVFYNAGHIGPRHRTTTAAYTHYELESLPSGGWGYLHFPLTMRYTRGLGHDCLGMTGKFHTSWGDFHSFKNEAALQFESFTMLVLGGKCSVGDQLHPSGRLDPYTYELIGGVYHEVKRKEPWCHGATAVTDIGVFTPEEFSKEERTSLPAFGAVRMLQELRLQFDVLDSSRDLTPYRLVVLPDEIPLGESLAAKLEAYLANGGAVIASYRSGLRPQGDRFATEIFGVRFKNEAPFSPDFIVPGEVISEGLRPAPHVMYRRGLEVEAAPDAQTLAQVEAPYFNRTWRHYTSHLHAPSRGETVYPGIVRKGRCIYFAHPVFTQYRDNAPLWCKRLVLNAVKMLLPERVLDIAAPSSVLASLNHQPGENRYVLHLLHYLPERRGGAFDTVEEVIPVYQTAVSIATPKAVTAVTLVPEGEPLAFEREGGRVAFMVPEVAGHRMVAIAFG